MKTAIANGIELWYETRGSGEPVLLISPVLADGFVPFMAARALSDQFLLVRYHRRGWGHSTHPAETVTIADHAADAATLLERLGFERVHVIGHSSGGSIALQLALDHAAKVSSLSLLEPSLLQLAGAAELFEKAAPAVEAYEHGDAATAITSFLSAVSGLPVTECTATIEQHAPGAIALAIDDVDTFFAVELPALQAWQFGPLEARRIAQPCLSVFGSETEPLWRNIAELLRENLPQVEEIVIQGVGHLLHLQEPRYLIARLADFLLRHPILERSGVR